MLLSYIVDLLLKSAFNIVLFIASIALGFLLILLFFIIVAKIAQYKLKHKKQSKHKELSANPQFLINNCIDNFMKEYGNKKLSLRFKALKENSLILIKDIAKTYYPESEHPVSEIKFKHLILLSKDVVNKVDNLVNDIVNSSFFKLAWFGYAGFHNIKSKIKAIFSKEKNEGISMNVRNLKISYIMHTLDKMKDKTSNSPTSDETKKYFVFDSFINNKICSFFNEIGEEAILVFSGKIDDSFSHMEVSDDM